MCERQPRGCCRPTACAILLYSTLAVITLADGHDCHASETCSAKSNIEAVGEGQGVSMLQRNFAPKKSGASKEKAKTGKLAKNSAEKKSPEKKSPEAAEKKLAEKSATAEKAKKSSEKSAPVKKADKALKKSQGKEAFSEVATTVGKEKSGVQSGQKEHKSTEKVEEQQLPIEEEPASMSQQMVFGATIMLPIAFLMCGSPMGGTPGDDAKI